MFDGCGTSLRLALRDAVESRTFEVLNRTRRDLSKRLLSESFEQRPHPKAIMFP